MIKYQNLSIVVRDVMRHYIDERAQSLGDEDPYIVYMRTMLQVDVILPFVRKVNITENL